MKLMRERTLGNSATALMKRLAELHSEEWLHRIARYLSACEASRIFAPSRPRFALCLPLAG